MADKRVYFYALLVFLYLLFAIINTYPLVNDIGTKQLGDGGDGPDSMWSLWWTKTSLVELHQLPWQTDYLYYPLGTDIYQVDINFFMGLLSIPLQYTLNNLILVYNILSLLNFVVAGIAMYFLARHFTKNRFACFLAGYIFAFCPYVMGHALGHFSLMTTGFMPLFILFFIKFHENPSLKNILLSSLFLVLVNFASIYYTIFMLFFSIVYEFYYLAVKRFKVDHGYLIKLALIFIIFFAILSPLFIGILISKFSGNHLPNWDPDFWSADIFTFFIPGTLSNFGDIFRGIGWWERIADTSHMGAENQNFLGYVVLAVALYGLLRALKKKKEENYTFSEKYYAVFFLISSIIFAIFALGTKFKLFSHVSNINLPYHYVYSLLPFVSVPGRFVVIVVMSAAVLFAIGVSYMSEKLPIKIKPAVFLILFTLIAMEFLSIPYQTTGYEVPEFYKTLASEKGDFAIHDLSGRYDISDFGSYNAASSTHMYYQTIHGKKITGGRNSRARIANIEYVLKGLSMQEIIKFNIKYVIMPIDAPYTEEMSSNLSKENFTAYYNDSKILVYRAP